MHIRRIGTIAFIAVAAAACGSSGSKASNTSAATTPASTSAPATTAPASATTAPASATTAPAVTAGAPISVAQLGDDMLLVNDKGMTVYAFTPDSATASQCNSGCDGLWPPVTVTGTPSGAPTGITFGALTRSDGSKQLTVNGHPVYTYSGDTAKGDKNGEGVGGKWYYLNATGALDKS